MVSLDRTVQLSFVEFDEKGDFWDRRQLGRAGRHIENAKKPVLLVLFIHGWHHNAADRKPGGKNPGDVETFRRLLSELALSESTRNLQVHGVYLGWRGRLVQGPLDYLTFLDRKNAATSVAGTPVTETIFELIRQARKYHQGSKCVVIGHSFGALVLEKAMAQAMAGSVLAQDVQSRGQPFNAPADLILLVNSAAESIYAKEMKDMFARIKHRGSVSADHPLRWGVPIAYVVIAVLGMLSTEDADVVARWRWASGTAIGFLVDSSTWLTLPEPARLEADRARAATALRLVQAGWRVTGAAHGDRLPGLWQQVSRGAPGFAWRAAMAETVTTAGGTR